MRYFILYAALWLLPLSFVQAQEAEFKASAPTSVAQGSRFQLVYSLNERGSDLRVPDLPDFQILMGPSTSQSSSTQIINGTVSRSVNFSYTFILRADKVGRFDLPPATIVVDGKTIESNRLSIEVVAGDANSSAPAQGGQTQPSGADTGSISDEDVFITTTANKTEVWQDEAVLLTTKIYTRVNLEGISDVQHPELRNFVVEELPAQSTSIQWEMQNVGGKTYRVGTFSQRVIYPQTAGRHTIEPTSIDFLIRQRQARRSASIFDDFFDSHRTVRKKVRSKPVTLQVKALPSPRPAHFSGIVGEVTMEVSASKTEAAVNDGITIKTVVTGTGNHRLARNPELNIPHDFDVFDPNISNSIRQTARGGQGSRTMETLIIPRHPGTFELPPVEYSFFNTATGRYQTLRSRPITITVERGSGTDEGSVSGPTTNGSTQERVRFLGQDIRYLKTGPMLLQPANSFLFGSSWFILGYLLPLVLFILLFLFNQKRIKENADLSRVRNRKANKVARRRLKKSALLLKKGDKEGFYEELARALWGYVSDKLSIPRASLTKDNVRSVLMDNGASAESTEEFLHILDTCEYARYAPQNEHSERDQLYQKTMKNISQLEEQLKMKKRSAAPLRMVLGLILLMSSLPLWAQPDEQFERANQMYADGQFEEAIAQYEAVLQSGLEAPELYYNLGNAYYRQGLLPAAILNYERALLLAPHDKDVRYNLNLAYGQITDKIEPVGVFFLSKWFAGFRNSSKSDTWAIVSIVSFVLFLAGLFFFFFAKTSLYKKLSFFVGVLAFLVALTTFVFSAQQKQHLVQRDRAIVFSPSVTVRSAPEAGGTELFVLHEGTRVKLLQQLNNWYEIELQDGNVGWMHAEHLEVI